MPCHAFGLTSLRNCESKKYLYKLPSQWHSFILGTNTQAKPKPKKNSVLRFWLLSSVNTFSSSSKTQQRSTVCFLSACSSQYKATRIHSWGDLLMTVSQSSPNDVITKHCTWIKFLQWRLNANTGSLGGHTQILSKSEQYQHLFI